MSSRTDEHGRALAGSQLQIQIYVNRRQGDLKRAICATFPELDALKPRFAWKSPLEAEGFVEYLDEDFMRRVGLGEHAEALHDFWSKSGARWDALARIHSDKLNRSGVLLIKAKSQVSEMASSGCHAGGQCLLKIESALFDTRDWLRKIGVETGAEDELHNTWLGKYYQTANRLAHLYFIREKLGVPCWLVNVLFVDDPHSPTTEDEWRAGIRDVHYDLGLASKVPYFDDIFLPARDRTELEDV